MPALDGTGPMGMGPINLYSAPFRVFPYHPFGRGRGLRRWWW